MRHLNYLIKDSGEIWPLLIDDDERKNNRMLNPVLIDLYCNGNLVEDMESYRPGGFHPVHLGDILSICSGSDRPRYKVLQKLGQGKFSTVWLVQDMADHEYVGVPWLLRLTK